MWAHTWSKQLIGRLLLAVAAGLVTVFIAVSYAAAAQENSFGGEVMKADAPFTVRVEGREFEVTPASNVMVTRDGNPATLADIQPGDRVNIITSNPGGVPQRIDATSSAPGDDWVELLPLLLLLPLLFGFLLWALRGRRDDSFVLERIPAASQVRG